ncbi:transglutaminase-like domain-containing protein [Bifidobacterium eulemuris]|uniref:Transglutaminase domain-containing protein n=1 Tax=Bifidobacterium eulemuris TaxID=1765219 RepID=A0A261G7Q9_9BIFI|nr:transglutaminase-like domain-containing protein [Bifidobacterium eulemuris]OZG67438.1 Transglutaminase-like superfamily [Bifidobacterium eulemuris]QOL33004.1 transglutaminase domain-containing protein [Bifidobacterium eulemuris]
MNVNASNNPLTDIRDADMLMRMFADALGPFDLRDGRAALAECARHAAMLRREMDWTRALPDDVFVHYVAWPRVNNERLVPCRERIWMELRDRVQGLDMERAAIEANYWCAEHVTYAPTDGRTISPAGALNRGVGRCGEESTLLVTALRSIGIPARQIYTPRWAHCDDNHAWVEARIDGVWRFMGACEPEERLDRGWFDRAATRAMLVHTRVFSDYSCGNVNVSRSAGGDGYELLENVTDHYAPVTRLTVRVMQADSVTPARGATVSFQLLNMAEYSTIAALDTDDSGTVSLTLGKGSVRVHAAYGDRFAETTLDTARVSSVTLTLDDEASAPDGWRLTDLTAPVSNASRAQRLTADERARGAARAARAEAMRVARLEDFARLSNTGDARMDGLLAEAGGNWPTVSAFLIADDDADRLELVRALRGKDLADVTGMQLRDAYECAKVVRTDTFSRWLADMDDDEARGIWRGYVLNARVDDEELTEHRLMLHNRLTADERKRLRTDPQALYRMLADLDESMAGSSTAPPDPDAAAPAHNALTLALPLDIRDTPLRRAIAFVRACRALGVPARLDPQNRLPQYFDGSDWRTVPQTSPDRKTGAASQAIPSPTVAQPAVLRLRAGERTAPRYAADWTLGRLCRTDHGLDYTSLDLTDRPWRDGCMTVTLDAGRYRLITTTRLPNGNQLAAERVFDVVEGDVADIELLWREPREDELVNRIELEEVALTADDGAKRTLRGLMDEHGRAGSPAVLCVLDANGSEPSIHVLDELRAYQERVGAAGETEGPQLIVATCPGDTSPAKAIVDQLDRLPLPVTCYGCEAASAERLARITFVDPEKLPLLVVAHVERAKTVATYACSGYSVGSVELAVRLASR